MGTDNTGEHTVNTRVSKKITSKIGNNVEWSVGHIYLYMYVPTCMSRSARTPTLGESFSPSAGKNAPSSITVSSHQNPDDLSHRC